MGVSMPAVLCVVGVTGAGKTTLIERVVPALVRRGIRVGTVKHDVHGFEMDREGKDSWRHKRAGAHTTLISSPAHIGMVRDADHDHTLAELTTAFLGHVDLVLTEGYRREALPKLEVHRGELGRSLLTTAAEGLVAVVTDETVDAGVPELPWDGEVVADFVLAWMEAR